MSEQTIQDELYSIPVEILDKYTCLSLGATTINDLITSGKLNKNIKVSKNLGKKPDVLIVNKNKEVVVFIEFKKPTEFDTPTKIQKAIDQEIDVAKEVKAKIYIVSDGDTFIWINPLTKNRILNPDGTEVRFQIKPKENEKSIATFIDDVKFSISKTNDKVLEQDDIDPTDLAIKIANQLKRLTFTSSKKSLYTFVELFIFKYLSDIEILPKTKSFEAIYSMIEDSKYNNADVLHAYLTGPREYMKTLFPNGVDGTTIINGQVFHLEKDDKNAYIMDKEGHYIDKDQKADVFVDILKQFYEYEYGKSGEPAHGKFIKINKDFKSKLFEQFMKKSDQKDEMGQFFTPLKVVQEMVSMVDVHNGMKICDPACGVGKFLLEAIDVDTMYLYNSSSKKVEKQVEIIGLEKKMDDEDENMTVILAKANALITFSKLFKENNDEESIKIIAKEILNETFESKSTFLGTLGTLKENEYDLILANPPYYRDKNISDAAKNTGNYTLGGQGVEGLFLEWIIKSLKPNGIANIVLPDGIFSNIGNKKLKEYTKNNCDILSIISLPTKTFFNTQKKTYILTLRKRNTNEIGTKQTNKVFCYLCKTIGETLDVYRFDRPNENDLHEATNKYNNYRNLKDKNKIEEPFKSWFDNDKKLKLIDIDKFIPSENWCIETFWSKEELIDLGFKEDENVMSISELNDFIGTVLEDIQSYKEVIECLIPKE